MPLPDFGQGSKTGQGSWNWGITAGSKHPQAAVEFLRFLLQTVRADFYNPVTQFLVKLTNPPLKPLRRIIPGWGGIDVASLVLAFVLQFVAMALLLLLSGTDMGLVAIPGLLLATLTKLVSLVLYIYLFGIFILALLSWINPGVYNPIAAMLYSITEPLLRPAQRLIPPIGGIDLSPLAVILVIYVVRLLVIPPLLHLTLVTGFPATALGLI